MNPQQNEPDNGLGSTLVTWGLILLLVFATAATLIPHFVKSRVTRSKNACVNNLRQIDGAKEQWGLEFKRTSEDTPTAENLYGATNYIKVAPVCPAGGTYTIGKLREMPRCSVGGEGHSL